MTNQENVTGPQPDENPGSDGGYRAGQRSITHRATKSRFDILREKKEKGTRGRPFIYGGIMIVLVMVAVLGYAFWDQYVAPPRALAIRVGEVEYSRGDVVDLIRFNQRLSEEIGIPFQLGNSVFDVLGTIQEAEMAYQLAPQYGVSVSPQEIEERIEFILGFALQANDRESGEVQVSIEESKRQFLNRVGLPESVWRDFLTKVMFQERLREVVGDSIPRIQPQVHVYQIILNRNNEQTVSQIERALGSGIPVDDVVKQYSTDPEAARGRGDLGWVPAGVVTTQVDRLLFGTDEEGERILPFRTASTPRFDSETNTWTILIVDEFQEAREVNDDALEVLKDKAMTKFFADQRPNINLYLDLTSGIASWMNKQVRLNSVVPTAGPSQDPLQGLLPDGVTIGGQPTPVPTPRGIPGFSEPVQ